jgi:hypothetical protein
MPSDQLPLTCDEYKRWEDSLEYFLRLTGSIIFTGSIFSPGSAGPPQTMENLREALILLRADVRSALGLIRHPHSTPAPTKTQLSLVDDAGLPFDPLGELPSDEQFPEPATSQSLVTRPAIASLILAIFKSCPGIIITSHTIFYRLETEHGAIFSEMDRQSDQPSHRNHERWRTVATDALQSLWATHADVYRLGRYTYIYAPPGHPNPSNHWIKS